MAGLRLAILVVVACAAASPASADEQRRNPPSASQDTGTDDFMFGKPRGSIGITGSWVFARAGSDLFDFVTDQLTIDRGDFSAPAFGAYLGVALSPRLEAQAGFDYSRSRTASEYRRFIGSNNLPISQDTLLKAASVTGSLKFALTERGRSVSRLAWIPRGVTPFIGGGAGAVWYDFQQFGDFVDYVDLSVFADSFRSRGWTPSAHAFGGVDLQVYRRMFLTVEGRYQWAAGELGRDFVDFDPIDLAGFRMSAGVSVLF